MKMVRYHEPAAKWTDPEALASEINEYFQQVEAAGTHGTITGLALHLGYSRRQMLNSRAQRNDACAALIKRAICVLSMYHEQRLGGSRAVGSIFWLKCHGWRGRAGVETSNLDLYVSPSQDGTGGDAGREYDVGSALVTE